MKVGNPQLELSPDKQSMYLSIPIDEGPQFRSARSTSRASCSAPRENFLSACRVKTGEIFNRSKLAEDLQKLTDYYKDQGYAYVNVTPLDRRSTRRRGPST